MPVKPPVFLRNQRLAQGRRDVAQLGADLREQVKQGGIAGHQEKQAPNWDRKKEDRVLCLVYGLWPRGNKAFPMGLFFLVKLHKIYLQNIKKKKLVFVKNIKKSAHCSYNNINVIVLHLNSKNHYIMNHKIVHINFVHNYL